MAKLDPKLHLTEQELHDLLSTESRLRIATLGPDDRINLTPMTFGWAAGNIYIFARGQKVANLRRRATATVLIDTGSAWRELKGIMIYGLAKVLETAAEEGQDHGLAEARLNLGLKHNLKEDGAIKPYPATASGNSRRWIVFTPEKVISWNNENLG